ncbi:MAG: type II toxin-antitoxin system PemK/MazF family toxin [Synergistaceae bacterium]
MRFSDINVGHIYNVIFDPVRNCEFDGKHLALVLKKNNDKNTFIVMPLTSQSNGDGVNKIKLGNIKNLPSSLSCNDTYAVYNQIRTVNADRFIALKEAGTKVQVKIEDKIYSELFILVISDMLHSCDQDIKIEILKSVYQQERIIKAKNLAYNVLALKKDLKKTKDHINSLENEILDIIKDIPYSLEQKYIDDGIEDIFLECLAKI